MKIQRSAINLGILLACTACASTKTRQPEQAVIVYAPDQLGEMPQDEPPVEMVMVEELPPPPDADQYTATSAEEKAKALADTTVYPGLKLEGYPHFYYNSQNEASYIDAQIAKAKTEFKVKQKGVVRIKFVVERDGSITKPVVLDSDSEILTKHSLAILKQMPKWRPGSLNGWERRAYTTLLFNW